MNSNQSFDFSGLTANQLIELQNAAANQLARIQTQANAAGIGQETTPGGGPGTANGQGAAAASQGTAPGPVTPGSQMTPLFESPLSAGSIDTNSQVYRTPLMTLPVLPLGHGPSSQLETTEAGGPASSGTGQPAPKRRRGKVTAEVARLVIKHRGQGMSNRQIAELYNIAPQTCSNISSRYLKTGHFRPTTKRVYKKKPTINKAQSLVLQWLSNEPLLTPRGAWLRLSTESIFVSQKSVYNMLDKSTLSIGLVKPALYRPCPEGPSNQDRIDVRALIRSPQHDDSTELVFVSCFRVRGALREAFTADPTRIGKTSKLPSITFGSIFVAVAPAGLICYKYSEDPINDYNQVSSMVRLLGIIRDSPKKVELVFSHWSEHFSDFTQLARDANIPYMQFPMGLSNVHLGDVIMYNLSHLIGSENPENVTRLRTLLTTGSMFISNRFVKSRFVDISDLINGVSVPLESAHLFPLDGDVFRPVFPQVSLAQYTRAKAIAEGKTPSGDAGEPEGATVAQTEPQRPPTTHLSRASSIFPEHQTTPISAHSQHSSQPINSDSFQWEPPMNGQGNEYIPSNQEEYTPSNDHSLTFDNLNNLF